LPAVGCKFILECLLPVKHVSFIKALHCYYLRQLIPGKYSCLKLCRQIVYLPETEITPFLHVFVVTAILDPRIGCITDDLFPLFSVTCCSGSALHGQFCPWFNIAAS